MNHRLITIEGNIGAGKTSLATMLSEKYNTRLVLEKFIDNPFLPKFYKDPQRYAFSVETAFLSERYHQFNNELINVNLREEMVVTDYSFYKSLIFARQTLDPSEFVLFSDLFKIINRQVAQPGLFVYLHNSIDQVMENIHHRGRDFEQEIEASYLNKIESSYFKFMHEASGLRCVIIETVGLDFVKNKSDFEYIDELLQKDYPYGVTVIPQRVLSNNS